ncbi:hypothetical protein CR513_22429, partial [Mucuna pruriens]
MNDSHMCMDKARQCKEKLLLVMNGAVNIEKQLVEYKRDSERNKIDYLQAFIGSNIAKELEILPPQFSKTKGNGKKIKGGKENGLAEHELQQEAELVPK